MSRCLGSFHINSKFFFKALLVCAFVLLLLLLLLTQSDRVQLYKRRRSNEIHEIHELVKWRPAVGLLKNALLLMTFRVSTN